MIIIIVIEKMSLGIRYFKYIISSIYENSGETLSFHYIDKKTKNQKLFVYCYMTNN